MAQQEIINLLTKKREPMSLIDLSRSLNINKTNIARACRKLKKNNEIRVIKKRESSFIRHLVTVY
jgi:predicted transcriptional regulator